MQYCSDSVSVSEMSVYISLRISWMPLVYCNGDGNRISSQLPTTVTSEPLAATGPIFSFYSRIVKQIAGPDEKQEIRRTR